MAFQEEEATEAKGRQGERRDRYAAVAGERLRETADCQFSLLPYEELVRTARGWYDACADAMLRGNYSPIDKWVREHAKVASEQGFELDDLLQLLRLCRTVAIEKEGWNEDYFADVDAVVDEGLAALRSKVAWEIPDGLNYLTGKGAADRERERLALASQATEGQAGDAAEPHGERRIHRRNKLHLPIRVKGLLDWGMVEEVTRTDNVAKGGVYFISQKPYIKGAKLQVMYPYWDSPGAINPEYPAEVVRIDKREEGLGVAVKFLVSLGKEAAPASATA